MLFDVSTLPFPGAGDEQKTIDALSKILREAPDSFAALIIEPLVLGAGGMKMYPASVLAAIAALCKKHDVFLIADEVMTGFGRTGTMFACEQAGVAPDIMCLSKGITGGFLPLAAVLTHDVIYERFLDADRERAFLHSHSYTGNPIACAAALASLGIFDSDAVIERNLERASLMAEAAIPLAALPGVAEVRQRGMIVAIEMARRDRSPHPADQRRGRRAYLHALEQGVLLRPLGDVLYWMPPYCIDDAQLELLAETTRAVVEEATRCA
jgi:adenosylmethionine-8-amino-7-oxononanoate aminotransferase